MITIKKGDVFVQKNECYNSAGEVVGEIGREVVITDARNTGLRWVDFKVIATGKEVIGQYVRKTFFEDFEKTDKKIDLTKEKPKKNKRRKRKM